MPGYMETYLHLASFPQWKQLYEMKKQKLEALEREMKLEEDKLIAQMEYARYILTQQLEIICTLQKHGLIKIICWSTCFWQFFLSSPRFNKLAFPFSYPSPPPHVRFGYLHYIFPSLLPRARIGRGHLGWFVHCDFEIVPFLNQKGVMETISVELGTYRTSLANILF
jgi:hypothetical protein